MKRKEHTALFPSNRLPFLNNCNDYRNKRSDWYFFDRIILKKIQQKQSQAIYRQRELGKSSEKPTVVRFHNSLLDSLSVKKKISEPSSRDNSSLSNHYHMIPSNNSLTIVNNRNRSQSNHYCNNSSVAKKDYWRNFPRLGDYIISNKKRVLGDSILSLQSDKSQEFSQNSSLLSNKLIESIGREEGAISPRLNLIAKRFDSMSRVNYGRDKELNEIYNVSNCDYTILSKKNTELFKTRRFKEDEVK